MPAQKPFDPRLARQSFFGEADVRALLKRRGWTVALLAQHWRLNKQYIYRLIENEQRPPHWDAAFRGLGRCPVKPRPPGRPPQRRAAGQPGASVGAPGRTAKGESRRVVANRSSETTETPEELRKRLERENTADIEGTLARLGRMPHEYLDAPALPRNLLRPGQVVTLLADARGVEADTRGVVLEIIARPGAGERYRIAFADASVLLLLPHEALQLLFETGEQRDLAGLDLSTDLRVRVAIAAGQLRF